MSEIDFILETIAQYQETPRDVSSDAAAKRTLAVQLRRLNNMLCATHAPEEQILELSELLEEHASLLEAALPDAVALEEGVKVMSPEMVDFSDRSPFFGQANPISPPASYRYDIEARVVRCEVTFGKAMEGAPGRVHGGLVAAILDEVLGHACMFAGSPAMTAEFTTRFLHATPVEKPLVIEAKLDGVDGRKVRSSAHVHDGERVVVEAEGLFIAVDTERFRAIFRALAAGEPLPEFGETPGS